MLAEASAAIEVIRAAAFPGAPDASLGYGTAGEVELLLSARMILGEDCHLNAARRFGKGVIETAKKRGGYGSAFGEPSWNPSLFTGLAGTGLVMLRLHDPALVPSGLGVG